MKKQIHFISSIFLVAFFLLTATSSFAQSAPQYTQFFFNKLIFNPAYAGSKEVLSMSAHYRHQWDGVEGAPRTATVSAHLPFFHNRCGGGISVTNDKVGLVETNYLRLSYAYRMPIKKNRSTLSIGFQGVFQSDQFNWRNAELLEEQDAAIPFGEQMESTGNFGLGVYYSSSLFYAGLSMPQFFEDSNLQNDLNLADSTKIRTYHLMSGFALPLGDKVVLKPAFLISYNPNTPIHADLNLSVLLMNALWIGATYRTGDSIDAVLQYQFNKRWRAGIAYDYTTSELASYSNGSMEFMVEYLFDKDKDQLKNLRFF